MTTLLKRVPLLLFIASLFLYGCSGNGVKVKTPKEAADLFVQSLKENNFKKFSVFIPTKSTLKSFIKGTKMTDEQKEKAYDRIDEQYSKKDPFEEYKRAFDNVRSEYDDDFWKEVKVTGYEGIDPEKQGEVEGAEVFIKLEGKSSSGLELKLGEIMKIKGTWYLFTQPRWI